MNALASGANFLLNPAAWPLLLVAPALWCLLRWHERRAAARLADLAGPRATKLAPGLSPHRRALRGGLLAGGALLAAVACLEPVWGAPAVSAEGRGVDIVVCLDVSRSMLARDVAPTRLARAKAEIRALAERTRGDRIGLVVFAGESRLLTPLTRDMRSFAAIAATAEPESVLRGGTDVGGAIDLALAALVGGVAATGDHETILLLTDGEDLGASGAAAAERCAARGISVHTIGLGSPLGSKIAVPAEEPAPGRPKPPAGETFLRDRAGREIVSALDVAALRRIAETARGTFRDVSASPRPLVSLYEDEILAMARKEIDARSRRERPNRFQWPLAGALALWILALALPERRRP